MCVAALWGLKSGREGIGIELLGIPFNASDGIALRVIILNP
jgi:hypothetical protein